MKTKQVEMEAMREAELKLKRKVCYVKIQIIIIFFSIKYRIILYLIKKIRTYNYCKFLFF